MVIIIVVNIEGICGLFLIFQQQCKNETLPSKQLGFKLGIDDYMVKPVEFEELHLRVRALLRRVNIEVERKIEIGNLLLDADGMSAEIDGEKLSINEMAKEPEKLGKEFCRTKGV